MKSKVILRPHIIYGPGDTTIGPRIKKAIRGSRFIIPGDGTNHISFTHVENLAHAILQSVIRSKPGISVYNITDADSPVFNEAVSSFKKLNGLTFTNFYIPKMLSLILATLLEYMYKLLRIRNAPTLTPYIVHQMTSDHILDISKAVSEIGYSPTKTAIKDFYL